MTSWRSHVVQLGDGGARHTQPPDHTRQVAPITSIVAALLETRATSPAGPEGKIRHLRAATEWQNAPRRRSDITSGSRKPPRSASEPSSRCRHRRLETYTIPQAALRYIFLGDGKRIHNCGRSHPPRRYAEIVKNECPMRDRQRCTNQRIIRVRSMIDEFDAAMRIAFAKVPSALLPSRGVRISLRRPLEGDGDPDSIRGATLRSRRTIDQVGPMGWHPVRSFRAPCSGIGEGGVQTR